jgi:hypothetical protein
MPLYTQGMTRICMTTPGMAIVVLAQCDQQSNETSPHDKAGRAAGRGDGPYRCHRERYAMAAPSPRLNPSRQPNSEAARSAITTASVFARLRWGWLCLDQQ